MSEWVICEACGLKHRPKNGVCPRCEKPVGGDDVYTTALTDPPTENSALGLAVPVGILLAVGAGFVFIGPLGGRAAGAGPLSGVLLGLLLIFVSWVWSMSLAWRAGIGWFLFALCVPYVSVMVMGKWNPFFLKLTGTALVVLGVMFAPAGLRTRGPTQAVGRACEAQSLGTPAECACIGTKTVGLMSPAERRADFNGDHPQSRDMMQAAALLCRKERLTEDCVIRQQGSGPLCACMMNEATAAFTPEELDDTLERVANGAPPVRWATIRTDCMAKLPKPAAGVPKR